MAGWYDPTSTYGATYNFNDSPWQSTYLNDTNPQAAYQRWGAAHGMPIDDTAMGQWFRQHYARSQDAYGSAIATNPLLQYTDYLNQQDPLAMYRQFAMQSASGRGENLRSYAPAARWQNRG